MPGQLLAAFKAAAPRLGISPRLVHAVDWLFRFTQPQDWEEGSRPIVWPSASMQQEALGLSPTQAKAAQPPSDRARPRHDEGQPERQALRQARPADGPDCRGLRLRSRRRSPRAMPNSAAWRRRAGRSAPLWAACAGARRSRARASRRSSRRPPNTRSRARSGKRSPARAGP